ATRCRLPRGVDMLRFLNSSYYAVRVVLLIAVWALIPATSVAQTYVYATGSPTFNTAYPVESGFVNVANGNLHMEIPLASPPQRGSLRVGAKLVYDSRIWKPVSGVWYP